MASLAIWRERGHGVPWELISARFHEALAEAIVEVAAVYPELPVVLSGGVFQNRRLVESLQARFKDPSRLRMPCAIPPNDGGLAAGQLAWSAYQCDES